MQKEHIFVLSSLMTKNGITSSASLEHLFPTGPNAFFSARRRRRLGVASGLTGL
jgi:hypothetical protein